MEHLLDPHVPSSIGHPFHSLLSIPAPIPDSDDSVPLCPPESILLNKQGYISPRENYSTAFGFARGKRKIKVTFWPACPPSLSCFTVYCPALENSAFGDFPQILTTEDDLALLRVAFCHPDEVVYPGKNDYFVYQAARGQNKRASLERIPPPIPSFPDTNAALLRCRDSDMYYIAILNPGPSQYDLHLYNSKTRTWSTELMDSSKDFDFRCVSKTITIGGIQGSVGWVDLWRGIVICDLLSNNKGLRYIPLPSSLVPKPLKGPPVLIRDIIVVKGEIKYFDMHTYRKPVLIESTYRFTPDGWEAATWKLDSSKNDLEWEDECKINIADVMVDPVFAPMLPDPHCGHDDTQPILKQLYAGFPALSLHDDVVCIMNRLEPNDNIAWVVAVDMRQQTLKDVVYFASEGWPIYVNFYFVSGISKHLTLLWCARYEENDAATSKIAKKPRKGSRRRRRDRRRNSEN